MRNGNATFLHRNCLHSPDVCSPPHVAAPRQLNQSSPEHKFSTQRVLSTWRAVLRQPPVAKTGCVRERVSSAAMVLLEPQGTVPLSGEVLVTIMVLSHRQILNWREDLFPPYGDSVAIQMCVSPFQNCAGVFFAREGGGGGSWNLLTTPLLHRQYCRCHDWAAKIRAPCGVVWEIGSQPRVVFESIFCPLSFGRGSPALCRLGEALPPFAVSEWLYRSFGVSDKLSMLFCILETHPSPEALKPFESWQ